MGLIQLHPYFFNYESHILAFNKSKVTKHYFKTRMLNLWVQFNPNLKRHLHSQKHFIGPQNLDIL
jgi:hypothetical protein